MANKLKIYKVEDSETGRIYQVEGPEGATADELGEFILSQKTSPSAPAATAAPAANKPSEYGKLASDEEAVFADEGAPQVGPRLTPEQEQEYSKFIQSPGLTPEGLNKWWQERGFGGLSNAGEVVKAVKEGRLDQGVNYGLVDNPITAEDRGLDIADAVQDDLEEAARQASTDPETMARVAAYNAERSGAAPVVSAPPVEGFWSRVGSRTGEMFDEAGEGFTSMLMRGNDDYGEEQSIRSWAQTNGMSPEEADALIEQARQNRARAVQDERAARGRYWNDQDARSDQWRLTRFVADLTGDTLGDPVGAILPGGAGKTALRRVGAAALANTGFDAVAQLGEISEDIRDDVDVGRLAANALGGAGLQGVAEAIGKGLGHVSGDRPNPDIEANEVSGAPRTRETLSSYLENQAWDAPKGSKRTRVNELVRNREAAVREANEHVAEVMDGWANAPEFEVVARLSDIKDKALRNSIDKDAVAAYGPDGRIIFNLQNIDSPEALTAVTFHEALGHHGLATEFGDGLDFELNRWYENGSSWFRKEVDNWLEANPNEYKDSPNRIERAAEEVLAEASERGQLPVALRDRITNYIKDFARGLGINLKYSKREIDTILGMAHRAVVDGKGRDVVGNGFKYAKKLDERQKREDTMLRRQVKLDNEKSYEDWKRNWEFDDFIDEIEAERANVRPTIETLKNNMERDFGPRWRSKFNHGTPETEPRFAELKRRYVEIVNREAEEVKFSKRRSSEASRSGERLRLSTKNVKRGASPGQAAKTFLNELGVFNNLELMEMSNGEAIDRAARLGVDQDWLDYYNDAKWNPDTKVIDTPTPRPDMERYLPDVKFSKKRQRPVDEEGDLFRARKIISDALETYEPQYRSWAEGKRDARARGLTAKQIRSAKSIGELDKKIFQYDAAAQATSEKLATLNEKIDSGEFTQRDKAAYLETVFSYNEMLGRIFDDQAEIGRALNAMKTITHTKRKLTDLNKALAEMEGSGFSAFASDDIFQKFAKQVQDLMNSDNPDGALAMLRSVSKPYWWQYILTFRHSMMLSGLGTHAKNATDNALMIARELEEAIAATPGFVVRKGLKAAGANVQDGVSPQEIAGRLYGLIRALTDSQTYKNTAEAFWKGHGNRALNSKVEMQDVRIPFLGKVQDTLHAADTFFRAFNENANLYSLGVRKAREEGFTGMAAFEEGSNYAVNPTKEMLDEAKKLTDLTLLVDTPSSPSAKLEAMKAIRPNMGKGEQLTAFFANLIFPFFRVTDRLLFQKLRRSPLSFLDRVTREDLAAGGARMDTAIARTLYGSALLWYYWNASGNEPNESNSKKREGLEATGWMGNSVEKDGKYVDAMALNLSFLPSDLQNSLAANIANMRKAYNKGEDISESLGLTALALGRELASNSFAENISQYMAPLDENEAKAETASANVVGGMLSSFIPAAVRQYNQTVDDPYKRDTTGDKGFTDRVIGRVKSGIPGLSEDLPQKYDALGDEVMQNRSLLGMDNFQPIKTDDVSKELRRLERSTDKSVVTGAPSSFEYKGAEGIPANPEYVASTKEDRVKLTAAGKQEWNRLQGWYLREEMKALITSEDWRAATDKEKIDMVKKARKTAYGYAKEDMLPQLLEATNGDEE